MVSPPCDRWDRAGDGPAAGRVDGICRSGMRCGSQAVEPGPGNEQGLGNEVAAFDRSDQPQVRNSMAAGSWRIACAIRLHRLSTPVDSMSGSSGNAQVQGPVAGAGLSLRGRRRHPPGDFVRLAPSCEIDPWTGGAGVLRDFRWSQGDRCRGPPNRPSTRGQDGRRARERPGKAVSTGARGTL